MPVGHNVECLPNPKHFLIHGTQLSNNVAAALIHPRWTLTVIEQEKALTGNDHFPGKQLQSWCSELTVQIFFTW